MSNVLRLTVRGAVLVGLTWSVGSIAVHAEPVAPRPSVAIDRPEVAPGEHVVLTIEGFTATSVTVSVCGNEDRRGSADCNMAASQSVDMHTDGAPSTAEIPVAAPPVGTAPMAARGPQTPAASPVGFVARLVRWLENFILAQEAKKPAAGGSR